MKDIFHVRSLHAEAVTAVDACSSRSFARHMHDEFGVGLVTGGAQRSWSGRGPVEAVRGNLITVNPAELHDGAPIGSDRSWSMLYFSQRIVSTVVADLEEGRSSIQELHTPVVIRHAYVLPEWQGQGIGARLLGHLCRHAERPILIGTWAAADWAIRFYERHGFARVPADAIAPLLRTYWTVPERQIATSVVLASPPLRDDAAERLTRSGHQAPERR